MHTQGRFHNHAVCSLYSIWSRKPVLWDGEGVMIIGNILPGAGISLAFWASLFFLKIYATYQG